MNRQELELFESAGNFTTELENGSLENIFGGDSQPRAFTNDNDGKYKSVTWECSVCPTHTCFGC